MELYLVAVLLLLSTPVFQGDAGFLDNLLRVKMDLVLFGNCCFALQIRDYVPCRV